MALLESEVQRKQALLATLREERFALTALLHAQFISHQADALADVMQEQWDLLEQIAVLVKIEERLASELAVIHDARDDVLGVRKARKAAFRFGHTQSSE